jgi:hypothetical protein
VNLNLWINFRRNFRILSFLQGDLPSIVKYKAAGGVMRAKAGLFWSEVNKMTTLDGQPRFKLLHQLMAGLLSIPVSNADSECGFSMLRKIHTDQRANLDQSTIIALMGMKFNSACKKATTLVKLIYSLGFVILWLSLSLSTRQ